ncbi:site-specific DNA-methyltransferase [Corynebacterium singulare]|uniref:site-specific DNA-methyltransferase n=1 Tax=Corynebacterium singulare TaxID=161899 RepID=UPI00119E3136|nr:site-specific DNA-methyltransferase [Corynebacterium singulare]
MIRDAQAANEEISPNSFEVQRLQEALPNYFDADGNFQLEKFQTMLKEQEVELSRESYELGFLGKSYAQLLTSAQTETVIVPNTAHNQDKRNADSRNVYITGDNLDALKHLSKSYRGKIKCIYIDPPYNTGKDDFSYVDSFDFTPKDLEELIGVSREEALHIIDLHGKASHSAWLTFMLPRLVLARNLLSNDGVIFISIDGNELSNLQVLLDSDVFGEQNRLGTIVWKNATDNNPSRVAEEHEYIVVFAKDERVVEEVWRSPESTIKDMLVAKGEELIEKYGVSDQLQKEYSKWFRAHKHELGDFSRYRFIDADGVYIGSQSVHNPGKEGYRYDVIHPETGKPTRQPLMGYRFPESTMRELLDQEKIIFGADENKIVELKVYAHEYAVKLPSVINLDSRTGANEVRELFGGVKVFTNPKPVSLLIQLLSFVAKDGDTVLDFFSGSSSTAHAVMALNARDGANRRMITVQIAEPITDKTDTGRNALAQGFSTIDEIGRKRIELAADKIAQDTGASIDYGFKHYTLVTPEQDEIDRLESFNPDEGLFNIDPLERLNFEDAPAKTVMLTTWAVHDGYRLTPEVKQVELDGYTLDVVVSSAYIIDGGFTPKDVIALIRLIESNQLHITHLAYFNTALSFEVLTELKQALNQVSTGKIHVEARW